MCLGLTKEHLKDIKLTIQEINNDFLSNKQFSLFCSYKVQKLSS